MKELFKKISQWRNVKMASIDAQSMAFNLHYKNFDTKTGKYLHYDNTVSHEEIVELRMLIKKFSREFCKLSDLYKEDIDENKY